MSTGLHVRVWTQLCRMSALTSAKTRGIVAAQLVLEGHCATRHEALRYVRALLA